MVNEKMYAIIFDQPGDPAVLYKGEVITPTPGENQLLVRVHATALNRADTLQRRGKYPPPIGESAILGLEIAGDVVARGSNASRFEIGERVFGLVGGGGYAEYCLLDEGLAMPIPAAWDYVYAAAIPEAFLTANETLFELGQLRRGESLLLHAAASGVGTAALQMAKTQDVKVYATAGSQEKCQRVMELGAIAAANYKTTDFLPWLMTQTENQGVDMVEDFVGQENFARNLAALKLKGRLVQVATMSGAITSIDLRVLMSKRLHLIGSVMRSQSLAEKRAITARFIQRWWDQLITQEIQPIIDRVYDWDDVVAAHERMERSENIGKIILTLPATDTK